MLQLWGAYKHWTKGPETRGLREQCCTYLVMTEMQTTNLPVRLSCCISQYSPHLKTLFTPDCAIPHYSLASFIPHSVKVENCLFYCMKNRYSTRHRGQRSCGYDVLLLHRQSAAKPEKLC